MRPWGNLEIFGASIPPGIRKWWWGNLSFRSLLRSTMFFLNIFCVSQGARFGNVIPNFAGLFFAAFVGRLVNRVRPWNLAFRSCRRRSEVQSGWCSNLPISKKIRSSGCSKNDASKFVWFQSGPLFLGTWGESPLSFEFFWRAKLRLLRRQVFALPSRPASFRSGAYSALAILTVD